MYVPISSCDRLIGFLSIQSYAPNAYTREDLALLKTLADHGAGALDRIQAEEKIKELNAELEERIAQHTAALRETVGELEAFSYSVSHDMRAPLRAMHGFAILLVEEYSGKTLDAEAQDYLQRISRSAARLDALIEDVLHYTRVLRGGFKMEPVDVAQLTRDLLDAHPEWKTAGVREWAKESVALRQQVYRYKGERVGYEYSYQNFPQVKTRLLQAGVRLGMILNEIYGS